MTRSEIGPGFGEPGGNTERIFEEYPCGFGLHMFWKTIVVIVIHCSLVFLAGN